LKCGIVVGESDARAEYPKHRLLSPRGVIAAPCHKLGIRRDKTTPNEAGRPIEILNSGTPIPEIL